MFRGCAGPTDRNLNKHQARRRKPSRGTPDHSLDSHVAEHMASPHEDQSLNIEAEEAAVLVIQDSTHRNDAGVEVEKISNEGVVATELLSDREMQHLNRRIRNVRESIQLSTSAVSSPINWEQNVLNAVQNCVNECFSIFSHYDDDEIDLDARSAASLAMFELVQLALQSGPLKGAKPGYFKRCGAEVARQALNFLDRTFPEEVIRSLHYTERQVGAIRKWQTNAQKAIDNNKPPSKSALKKQTKSKKSR